MGSSIPEKEFSNTIVNNDELMPYIYRSKRVKENENYIANYSPEIRTLYEMFNCAVKDYPYRNFIGHRPQLSNGTLDQRFIWKTYSQVDLETNHLSMAIKKLDLLSTCEDENGKINCVGIFSRNCEEWICTEIALLKINGASVAFYDSISSESIRFIINQTHLSSIFLEERSIQKIIPIKDCIPSLKNLILFDISEDDALMKYHYLGFKLYTYSSLIQVGTNLPVELNLPRPEDTFTICYTSGTTNTPKGVVLLHKNAIAAISGFRALEIFSGLSTHQTSLSYLPLVHVYERAVFYVFMSYGNSIGMYNGDMTKLIEDLGILKPTFLGTVPRILNKIYSNIISSTNELSNLKKWLFNKAIDTKMKNLEIRGDQKHFVYDRLIFNKIKQKMGGNLEFLCSGSAPIDKNILKFFKIALGCRIIEGYGQTEAFAINIIDEYQNMKPGSIGPPVPCNEVTLMSIPEMNYDAKGLVRQGEICLKGPNVMNRYFNMPKATNETIDVNGWLHTGDIAQINSNGTFTIIDRKKNIFKLSQGEYIAPEKLEIVYSKVKFVSQVFVYGDSMKDFCVAIIVPDQKELEAIAKAEQIEFINFNELLMNSRIKKIALDKLSKTAKENKLNSLEIVKRIHFTFQAFSIENLTLTPTQKLVRRQIYNLYKKEIQQMYDS